MSLWTIAWRSIQQRGLASFLTMLSMALGVMLIVAVLSAHGVVSQSFRNNSSLGYNLIVGAKGGKLQLTLNTMYYLSSPVENLPYDYYLEFLPEAQRITEYDRMQAEVADEARREGKFAQFTALAIPVCLGDYLSHFRVVGTVPAMFEQLRYGPAADRPYRFASGRNFQTYGDEHEHFESVLGAAVARELGLGVGDAISPSHGDPEGEGHAQTFTVVGVLAPTGTPNDRAAFVNIEGFYLMDDHAKPIEEDQGEDQDTQMLGGFFPTPTPTGDADGAGTASESLARAGEDPGGEQRPLGLEQREVTAILLRTVNDFVAIGLPNSINEGQVAQCVAPIREVESLFRFIVGPIQLALLAVTALICVVSGISILVSIYNSMSDRRHEIAVMRALGASRWTVMAVILLESVLLALGGGAIGWLGGHGLAWLASGEIERSTGVSVGFFDLTPPLRDVEFSWLVPIIGRMSPELLLLPALALLAIVVGLLPAVAAYRTDVAESLGK